MEKVDAEEASAVKMAAKLINEKIKAYKSVYTFQDDLEIALMCCLELTTDHFRQSHTQEQASKIASRHLSALENKLDRSLSLIDPS